MANKNISGDVNVEFTEAQSRQSLESGESVKTLFGKLRKWLTDLKPVAFSGSYNDLSNKPTIPTVNNGTLTIQQNGTAKATFTANQAGNVTANIDALATNAAVTLNGAITGTSSFSDDAVTIDTKRKSCVAGNNSGTASARPYYKVASLKGSLEIFMNYRLALYVQQAFRSDGAGFGILDIDIRTEAGPVVSSTDSKWLISASKINPEDFILVHDKTAGSIDIYCKCYNAYKLYRFVVLSESKVASIADDSDIWTLYNDTTGIAELPTGDNIVIAYSSLADVNIDIASDAVTSMTGYSKPLSTSAIATTDTLNEAIGKLEKGLDDKANTSDDAYGIDMYDDTLPIDITARGDNLEYWVIYGNNKPGKNLVNLANVTNSTSQGIEWTVDSTSGTITANGKLTSTFAVKNVINPTYLYAYNGFYLSCDTENRYNAFITIRDAGTSAILVRARSNESVLISNIPTTYCYLQIRIEAPVDTEISNLVFKPMIRAANTTPDFDPYHLGVGQLNSAGTGYELPIITKQTGKADITTNIYLGTSPLTEGQSLRKAQATTKDIPTYNGECTIDTSYPNKPKMEIIPTDSAINIINRLRRTSALNSNVSTDRLLYSPNRKDGIYANVCDYFTTIQIACGQAPNANSKLVFFGDMFYGGIGYPTSDSVNHFKFNDDCAGDSIGRAANSGAALSGSTLDLWYETAKLNGKKILTDDDINSWRALQLKVRQDDMSAISVGDQYTCAKGAGTLTWDVISKNIDTPADPNRTNALTLRVDECLPDNPQFDAPEALYACSEVMSAGTYHYTVGDTSYQFTTTRAYPIGGQFVCTDNATLYTYVTPKDKNPQEALTVTQGNGGTDLGTLANNIRRGNLNTDYRRKYGSNDWKESAIRQWLNSNKPAGQWWEPQNPWDRPPDYADTANGFLYDLDPDFLAVIGKTQVTTKYFDTSTGALNGTYTTEDYFFLMSQSQVSSDYSGEGTKYTPYSDNASRIMYKNGSATFYWLRSPTSSFSNLVYIVRSDGSVSNVYASFSDGVAPACNII